MKVLGRELVQPFEAFWQKLGPEIPIPIEYIEEGHSSVFGDQGADVSAPRLPTWASLPDDDLAYHVAHELAHIVLRQRGFPRTGRGPQYPPDSDEARVGGDIEELVLHRALEDLLAPYGFKRPAIYTRLVSGALKGLSSSPVPRPGTAWYCTWAIRYCDLQLELEPEDWRRLEAIYEERAPEVCKLGRELLDALRRTGWSTRQQALEAMVRIRDCLGLRAEGRVLVIDPVGGQVF